MDRRAHPNDVVTPRRSFFTRIAASAMAIGLTGLGSAPARAAAGADDGPDWPGTLKGRHRQVVDAYAANDEFSKCRTNGSANNTGKGKSHGTGPFDVAGTPMTDKVGKSICGDGQGARSDGNVWVIDVNDVEEERHRENRTAAANQSERESDRAARKHREPLLSPRKHWGIASAVVRLRTGRLAASEVRYRQAL